MVLTRPEDFYLSLKTTVFDGGHVLSLKNQEFETTNQFRLAFFLYLYIKFLRILVFCNINHLSVGCYLQLGRFSLKKEYLILSAIKSNKNLYVNDITKLRGEKQEGNTLRDVTFNYFTNNQYFTICIKLFFS